MANWSAPTKPALNYVVTPADWATYVADNTQHLYDQRVRSVAGTTGLQIEVGTEAFGSMGNGVMLQHAVAIPVAFASAPKVVVSVTEGEGASNGDHTVVCDIQAGVNSVTAGGFNITVRNNAGSAVANVAVTWHAVGVAA